MPDVFDALPPEVRGIVIQSSVDRRRFRAVLQRPDLDDRQRTILTARANGVPLEHIAKRLGISRQRVYQIQVDSLQSASDKLTR